MNSGSFTTVTLGAVCSSVDYGYTASASSNPDIGPKFLRITDIVPENLVWDSVPHCEIEPNKREKFLLDEGDIVVARTGATVGYAKQIWARPEGATFASYLVRFRPDGDRVDPRYLGQIVQSAEFKRWVKSVAGGAAQPNANAKVLGSYELQLPPVAQQEVVGRVLWAFDDLIENNRRRIEILEEMARLLYREWFVHFRYPGHEDLPLVDSELGPIPGDWEICRVDQVMGVVGGGTPSKKEEDYWTDGEIQWFTPSDLTKTGSMFALESGLKINELGLAKSSANLFPAGSVMMTSRATIGVLSFSTTEACTNQGFITCLPSERLSGGHIYLWLDANVPLFLQISTGATFKELTKSTFRKLLVAVPPIPLENEFCSLVEPLLQSVLNLLQQQRVLQASRDLLLPRLVSGELDISDFELDLEAVG